MSLANLKKIISRLQNKSQSKASDVEILCCLSSWDYMSFSATWFDYLLSNFPYNIRLWLPSKSLSSFIDMKAIINGPTKLLKDPILSSALVHKKKIFASRHHDNHAYMSYGISPFYKSEQPTMVLVVDGMGDDASISSYVSIRSPEGNNILKFLGSNSSIFDSLGILYQVISSSQGGWTPLSSEGRYMGASAWGNFNRSTNTYYLQLRQIVTLRHNGEISLNKEYVNWHLDPSHKPYKQKLIDVIGKPILPSECWNPDNVLNVDNVQHAPATVERCDKAAALQMVFEDCIFHLVSSLILKTKRMFGGIASNKLIWTGGCALNCVASMHLLEQFGKKFYERIDMVTNLYVRKSCGTDVHPGKRTLHLWIPVRLSLYSLQSNLH